MTKRTILMLALAAGCNNGDVVPPDANATDNGYGQESGTSGGEIDPHVCWSENAPANAVRYQCEGLAKATINGRINVDEDYIPDELNTDLIEYWAEGGHYYWFELFGQWAGESYDDPGVNACCLEDLSEHLDEAADGTAGEDVETVPQPAEACADDCVDQACRQVPKELRKLALEVPPFIPVIGKSYRKQLEDLADWTAAHHGDCYIAMTEDGVDIEIAGYRHNGTWILPNSEEWPAVTDLSVDGDCKIYDWDLPEQGRPIACDGINDNNDDGTFDPEGAGAGFGGFDTFVPEGGVMELDGPTIFGVQAAGTAPILGLGAACPRGECSRVDAFVDGSGRLELRRALVAMPESMTWAAEGMTLTIDEMHAVIERPVSAQLVAQGDELVFKFPEGELEVLFAGQIHGVPVKAVVTNSEAVTGSVVELDDGTQVLHFDPIELLHEDSYGKWFMTVQLDDLISVEHSPRANFEQTELQGAVMVDASGSFDPDGDALNFEWFVDGEVAGEGPMETLPLEAGRHSISVRVSDSSGRTTWSYGAAGQ